MRKRKESKAVHDPETLISKSTTLNPIKDDYEEEEEKAKDQQKGFFACYLLTSTCPRFKGHTYIGFTVNPRRRIRQHNGEIRCGAVRTKKRRPWEMVLCIYGFPTNVSALQFEWAWQHPMESLAVRQAAATFKSFSGVANKIKLAYTMLSLPNWESLNLTVNYFSTKYSKHSSSCPSLPEHMKVQVRSMDELCYTKRDESLFGDEDGLGDEDYIEASENSGSLDETCRDATINFSSDYSFSIYEAAYKQCGRFKQYGNDQPRDSSCLEVNWQRPFGLLSSLDTISPIISSTSAEETNELGRQRSEQFATTLNDEENQQFAQKQSITVEVANKDQQHVQRSTALSNVEVIDLLTPSPNCKEMSYSKRRRVSNVCPVIIDLT